jgi:hypothetical protein
MKLKDALKYLGAKVNGVEPKGYYITDIIRSIGDDYTPSLKLTVTAATNDDDLFDKTADELQEDIIIGETAIAGTLKYVSGYEAYSGDEQNGHFIGLKAKANIDGATITAEVVGGVHGAVTLDSDGLVICRITSVEQSIRFVVTKGQDSKTYNFALTDLVLADQPQG